MSKKAKKATYKSKKAFAKHEDKYFVGILVTKKQLAKLDKLRAKGRFADEVFSVGLKQFDD